MKNAQADYINAGYRYEKATSPDRARAEAEVIRHMLKQESLDDQQDARYLIERGRQEARQS